MARPELPGAAAPHSAACFSISVGGSHPLFQSPAKNALLFFVWLWYIGLRIVKAALKSSIFLFFLEQLCYFNLSPQGDGNTLTSKNHVIIMLFQLIPARGRKRSDASSTLQRRFYFNLSPQGDGNIKYLGHSSLILRFQLIPARGRKLDGVDAVRELVNISTYPRKGAKNSASKMVRSFSFACLNFLFSVGYSSMNRAAAAFSLPWLLYCDKMCYNRAKLKHLSQNIQLYSSFVVQLFHNS